MVEFLFGEAQEGAMKDRVEVPEGRHLMRVSSAYEKTSKKGHPMWELEFAHEDPDSYWNVRDYVVFTDKAAGFTRRKLRALGFQLPGDGSSFNFIADASECIGKWLECDIVHEEYDDKTRAKVKGFTAANQEGAEVAQEEEIPF